MGDSLLVFSSLDGFADRDNNIIYVPDQPPGGGADSSLSTVVHEMLHTNASGDFVSTVGGYIDEGQTEILAIKACTSQGVAIEAKYEGQRAMTDSLAAIVGAHTLQQGFFGGGSAIVAGFDAVLGEGTWARFKAAMAAGDREKVEKILKAPRVSGWAREKINIILGILDSWWVTDEDIARIVSICATASPDDLRAIRDAVEPELKSLSSHGQRARVRVALVS
jgi:hypothetical protein